MHWHKIEALLIDKIWGGSLLSSQKSRDSSRRIGESWEVSTLPEGQSRVGNKTLSEHLGARLSYVVKLLETTDHLSIQVHPPDRAGVKGKTECWTILEAGPDAGIYLGFKTGVTCQQLKSAIQQKDDISQLLNFYSVVPGDFFYTPAGSVHAIGKDVVLLEVQQACGITYRLWDWNRLGDDGQPRSLHVDQAMECLNFTSAENSEKHFKRSNTTNVTGDKLLVDHPDFRFHYLKLSPGEKQKLKFSGTRPTTITVLQGCVKIDSITLTKYESAIGNGSAGIFDVVADAKGAGIAWVE